MDPFRSNLLIGPFVVAGRFPWAFACCGEVCENVVALVSWKCGFFLRFSLPHLRFIRHCMLLQQPAGFMESLSYET